jgi:hypothetical protein
MDLRFLTSGEMVSVTEPWTGKLRPVFGSIEKIKAWIPDVESVHKAMLELDRALRVDETIEKLTERLAEVDRQHDDAIRTVFDILSGSIRFCGLRGRTEEAEGLKALLERLLPEGLSYVQRSYREEAGIAETMMAGLDEATRARLLAIPVCGGTLLEVVLLWGALGKELAVLEDERSVLVANKALVAREKQVKLEWRRVVREVLRNLESVKGQPEAVLSIREPVIDAVAKAEARAARRAAKSAGSSGTAAGASSGTAAGNGSDAGAAG